MTCLESFVKINQYNTCNTDGTGIVENTGITSSVPVQYWGSELLLLKTNSAFFISYMMARTC